MDHYWLSCGAKTDRFIILRTIGNFWVKERPFVSTLQWKTIKFSALGRKVSQKY